MAHRVYNFSAGPATLPLSVMEEVQSEVLDWQGLGLAAFEISHLTPEFGAMKDETEALLRELAAIPPEYHVLFCHGGANMQFSAVPLNLLPRKPHGLAQYVDTGLFSTRAMDEAERYGSVQVLGSSKATGYDRIPDLDQPVDPRASYLHITTNNTVTGTAYQQWPEPGDVPLVGDATSEMLSRPIDVERFGVLYAGAQKNLGPAGLGVVLVRPDLAGHAFPYTPKLLDYAVLAASRSMANTSHTFAIYVMHKVLKWTKAQGGVAGMEKLNREKAAVVYEAVDRTDFYTPLARVADRSIMNVAFSIHDEALVPTFLEEAHKADLYALKGHKWMGGLRASIYNAMPLEGARALAAFMAEFERRYG